MEKSIYSDDTAHTEEKLFTISVLTENKAGLLNHVTIIFNRRKINIESLNVSETEVKGVSRYTIVIYNNRETVEKVVKQLEKIVDVLGAFFYDEDEIVYQEIALFKVPTKIFMNGNRVENVIRHHSARVLLIEEDFIILEKTGHRNEIRELFDALKEYGVLEFTRSGRIAVTKSKRKTTTFIKQLEESKYNIINIA